LAWPFVFKYFERFGGLHHTNIYDCLDCSLLFSMRIISAFPNSTLLEKVISFFFYSCIHMLDQ
jgi:hypothetical protein